MLKWLRKIFGAVFGGRVAAPVAVPPAEGPGGPVSRAPAPSRTLQQRQDELTALVREAGEWVVFEVSTPATWQLLVQRITEVLMTQWRAGEMKGIKPEQAFFVRCDATTMTAADIETGRVVCLVGFAILRPAEFEIVRLAWETGGQ